MMKLTAVLALIGSTCYLFAQQTPQQVIASQGNHSTNESISLSWTLGEFAIETIGSNEGYYTQGFQQPEIRIENLNQEPEETFVAKLFPNPTTSLIELQIENQGHLTEMNLLSMNGKILWQKKSLLATEQIDISNLPAAQYLVVIRVPALQITNRFQVIKM